MFRRWSALRPFVKESAITSARMLPYGHSSYQLVRDQEEFGHSLPYDDKPARRRWRGHGLLRWIQWILILIGAMTVLKSAFRSVSDRRTAKVPHSGDLHGWRLQPLPQSRLSKLFSTAFGSSASSIDFLQAGRHLNGDRPYINFDGSLVNMDRLQMTHQKMIEILEPEAEAAQVRAYRDWWNVNRSPVPLQIVQVHRHEAFSTAFNESVWQYTKSFSETTPLIRQVWFNWDKARDILPLLPARAVEIFENLPREIYRAGFWRYAALAIMGGYYADTDVGAVKDLRSCGRNPIVWRGPQAANGSAVVIHPLVQANVEAEQKALQAGRPIDDFLPAPSFITGIERDYGTEGLSRLMQICNWAMASAPGHPIVLDLIRRIMKLGPEYDRRGDLFNAAMNHVTRWRANVAADWREQGLSWTGPSMRPAEAAYFAPNAPPLFWDPAGDDDNRFEQHYNDFYVQVFTGTAIYTDAVLTYLNTLGFDHMELAHIKRPMLVGDVLILPEVGFNAGLLGDLKTSECCLEHFFAGGWKNNKDAY